MPPFADYLKPFSSCCSHGKEKKTNDDDPRINDLGRAIEDDFATIRETYGTSCHAVKQGVEQGRELILEQIHPNILLYSHMASLALMSFDWQAPFSQVCITGAVLQRP